MNTERAQLAEGFRRHVCQTSEAPLGIVVAAARGSTVYDVDGREYLDLLAGIGVANIGHAHPAVVRAVAAQSAAYLHVGVYGEMVLAPQVMLARRLAELVPGALSVVYFTNSGAEAIEGALKTARKATGRAGLVAFEGSFHGDTCGALSIGGNPVYREPFEPLLSGVRFLPFADAGALKAIDETVAAVVIEPIQGEGGVRIPPDGYLAAVRARCDAVGALLIVDEVITGFGRTGRLFACEHWGLEPDLLVLAKALGGGMPLGAFVGRPEVMSTLSHDPPLAHVTTFGGHPVCCAAGGAALDVLVREQLPARAAAVGAGWVEVLRGLVGRGGLTAVWGRGLLLALGFACAADVRRFAARCFERGLILNWTLHRDTVVRLAPPLTIAEPDLERATAAIAEALGGSVNA